jgi:hypothetical protein
LGKYFGLPAQFWLNLQNDYDLRIAEGSGIGKGSSRAKWLMMLSMPVPARASEIQAALFVV